MSLGPYVFGPDRLGLMCIENAGLTDKLRHILPRLRATGYPFTDIFLPASAFVADRLVVRDNDFFAHVWDTPKGRAPVQFVREVLDARSNCIGSTGALELNIELPDDQTLKQYLRDVIKAVRAQKPRISLRLNVAPYKGYVLPVDMLVADPRTHVIAQAYFGNMDGRLSEAEVLKDMLAYGVPARQAHVMYAAMAGSPRAFLLPGAGYKALSTGSIYSDDLLLDSGIIR